MSALVREWRTSLNPVTQEAAWAELQSMLIRGFMTINEAREAMGLERHEIASPAARQCSYCKAQTHPGRRCQECGAPA